MRCAARPITARRVNPGAVVPSPCRSHSIRSEPYGASRAMRTRANTSNGKTSDTSAQDRRRSPRVPHRAVLTIRRLLPDGVGAPMTLALADLSSGGVGALHAQPLHVGDQYQVP